MFLEELINGWSIGLVFLSCNVEFIKCNLSDVVVFLRLYVFSLVLKIERVIGF